MHAPLLVYYVRWHYSEAFADIARLHGNFLWFVYNYFSIPLLIKTLFAPWRRLSEHDRGKSTFISFFSNLIINTIMRAIGLTARLTLLLFGTVAFVAVLLLGILFYGMWVFLPLVAIGFMLAGANALI